jgi:Fe-S-cluster-containing hydrogenase component 2
VKACPLGAAGIDDEGVHMSPLVCVDCGLCKDVCPQGAIIKVSTRADALLRETAAEGETTA